MRWLVDTHLKPAYGRFLRPVGVRIASVRRPSLIADGSPVVPLSAPTNWTAPPSMCRAAVSYVAVPDG
jgi:hypothetical protein